MSIYIVLKRLPFFKLVYILFINRILLVATSMFKPVPYNMIIANFTSPSSAFVHTTLFTLGSWLLLYSCSSRAKGMSVLHALA